MYGVPGRRIAGGGRALERNVGFGMKTCKSAQAQDKEWAKWTEAVHYPANKDSTQVLSGIGDEAYLLGNAKDGKLVGVNASVYVRKGLVVFALEIWDKSTASSADAAITVAKKIADQL